MEWLRWILLESFLALAIPLFLVNFALLVRWRRGGRARPLLIGLGVSAALLAVQALVVTRHEVARRILAPIELDVLAGRPDALPAALAPDFDADGMNAADFVEFAAAGLRRVRVSRLWRTRLDVTQDAAESFVVNAVYLADTDVGIYSGGLKTEWEITFVRRGGSWFIGDIRAIAVNNQPVNDLRELRP
jgi:hypothetical protein